MNIEKKDEILEVLKELSGYNKKLRNGIDQIAIELRGKRQADTDEFLKQIVNGIGWNIEVLNQVLPKIDNSEELFDKSKINQGIISLKKAMADSDDTKMAEIMQNEMKELLNEIEELYHLLGE